MGWMNFFKTPDIMQGINEYRHTHGAILLDVRTPGEYHQGHIPGSKNVPLSSLDLVSHFTEHLDAPLFVYCHSGARSRQATNILQRMGYRNVKNIGGIAAYKGKVES